jgi:hypothetical protein
VPHRNAPLTETGRLWLARFVIDACVPVADQRKSLRVICSPLGRSVTPDRRVGAAAAWCSWARSRTAVAVAGYRRRRVFGSASVIRADDVAGWIGGYLRRVQVQG